jgi:hypothetical protein
VPSLDLGSQPQTRSTTAEIEDWTWHVGVPVQVLADGIPMRETKDAGYIVCVNQIIEEHPTDHGASLHLIADAAYTCELSVRVVL